MRRPLSEPVRTVPCTGCGAPLPEGASYCPDCGSRQGRPPSEALFVDGHPVIPAASVASRGTRLRGCMIGLILVGLFVLGTGMFAFLARDGDQQALPSPVAPGAPLASAPSVAGQRLYPNRPEALPSDQERRFGEAADIGGVQATANSAARSTPSTGPVVADVILRATTAPHPYSTAHWKLRSPDGRSLDVSAAPVTPPLGSGEIAPGGTVSGRIAFDVGEVAGTYYLIWSPDPAVGSRGVWEVLVD